TFAHGSTDTNAFAAFITNNKNASVTPAANTALPQNATAGSNATAPAVGLNQTLGVGSAFPLTQTVIATNASGSGPATNPVLNGNAPQGSAATLSVKTWNSDPAVTNTFHLSIPSLGVDTDFTSQSLLKGASTSTVTNNNGSFRLTTSNTNY